jgi:hypothetical protein
VSGEKWSRVKVIDPSSSASKADALSVELRARVPLTKTGPANGGWQVLKVSNRRRSNPASGCMVSGAGGTVRKQAKRVPLFATRSPPQPLHDLSAHPGATRASGRLRRPLHRG